MPHIYSRACGQCGGPVRSHHEAFQLEVPARDAHGHFIYQMKRDPETGRKVEHQVMKKVSARGLGHWTCNRGCQPCKVVTTVKEQS